MSAEPNRDDLEFEVEPFSTWTGRARRWMLKKLPPDKLLPESQPSYVASWIYVFGMGAIASLAVVIASGLVLSLNGPSWWHVSSLGHFVNSTHLWSVEFFFLFMVVHLWGKFWMAAWRGGRVLTWITGVLPSRSASPPPSRATCSRRTSSRSGSRSRPKTR